MLRNPVLNQYSLGQGIKTCYSDHIMCLTCFHCQRSRVISLVLVRDRGQTELSNRLPLVQMDHMRLDLEPQA